jgi:hypothetical protein
MKSQKKFRRVLFLLVAARLIALGSASFAADRDDAFDILDSWTCIRWGEDNIAWVVHYPEELVEPWVRSEAERQNMRSEQAEELRRSFSDELRMGSATAILLSVYGYGAAQTNLAPLANNVALIDSSGRRIAPIVFEKKLDSPISGLTQGLVFFPLQSDKNFRISVKGLVPDRETHFIFPGAAAQSGGIETASAAPASARERQIPDEEVVVKIPTRKNAPVKPSKPQKPRTESPELPEFETDAEVFAPSEPEALPEPEPEPPEVVSPDPEKPIEVTTAPQTPKGTLDDYLKAWAAGDTDTMYSLLSSESKGRISKELFAREVMSGGFRNALRSGYKVNWAGNSAKVTVAKKVLFVRTLETRQVDFVAENDAWRVAW